MDQTAYAYTAVLRDHMTVHRYLPIIHAGNRQSLWWVAVFASI